MNDHASAAAAPAAAVATDTLPASGLRGAATLRPLWRIAFLVLLIEPLVGERRRDPKRESGERSGSKGERRQEPKRPKEAA